MLYICRKSYLTINVAALTVPSLGAGAPVSLETLWGGPRGTKGPGGQGGSGRGGQGPQPPRLIGFLASARKAGFLSALVWVGGCSPLDYVWGSIACTIFWLCLFRQVLLPLPSPPCHS